MFSGNSGNSSGSSRHSTNSSIGSASELDHMGGKDANQDEEYLLKILYSQGMKVSGSDDEPGSKDFSMGGVMIH